MVQGASTVDLLKNNAKTIGGVIGMEQAFFEQGDDIPDADEFFKGAKDLDVEDITYK